MANNTKIQEADGMKAIKVTLSTLWVFVLFNYLYCDVMTLMNSEELKQIITGYVGSLHITQGFLLGSAVLMEIPIAMILLSRILKYKSNRLTNIIAGLFLAAVQCASLFFGTAPSLHYMFFSTIEIGCDLFIAWYAWKWKLSQVSLEIYETNRKIV